MNETYCIHVSQKAFQLKGRLSDSEDKMSVNNLKILKLRALVAIIFNPFSVLSKARAGMKRSDQDKANS